MRISFSKYFPDYQHFLRFEKRYSPHTLTAYSNDLQQFADYLSLSYPGLELDATDHFHLRGWVVQLKEEGLSARSLNRKISAVNGYYKFLMRQGHSTKNPASLLHAQRLPERLPSFLKKAEADQLLDDITFEEGFSGATHRLILELLYATGMRRSELANLKESDIEWSLQQIRVMGKGGKERLLPVSNVLLDSVREYLAAKKEMGIQQPAVLSLPDGKKPYEKYIYNVARKYLGMVTTLKKRSPHILRHTFATHLLNNGANIQAIKELLGHSSIAATQVYTHINIEELKKVHKFNHPKG